MDKYSVDKKAAEYIQVKAAFEEELATWKTLFSNTSLTKQLESIDGLVHSAYEINEEAGLIPENDCFSEFEKFSLAVRFDSKSLLIRSLKDVPCCIKKEFDMSEESFEIWMKEEREALDTALIDMEDLIDSIDDSFQIPLELEELGYIIDESLQPQDALSKALRQLSLNLSDMWDDFSNAARSLICLSLNINEDVDLAALPALLYDN